MIHEIVPKQYHPEFAPRNAQEADYVLMFDGGGKVLLQKEDGILKIPPYGLLAPLVPGLEGCLRYLFSIDDEAFYLAMDAPAPESEGLAWENTMVFRAFQPKWLAFAAITGSHFYHWYRAHKYCGACGAVFGHSEKERALVCPACGGLEYPKISPVVIVGLVDGERMLVTKYAGRGTTNYALVAGFVEIGESFEDTVHREVMEEVGLRVKNVRYYKSQPWAFTDSLLAGFFCELDGDDAIQMDADELAEAIWIGREELGDFVGYDKNKISLTFEMMERFSHGEV